MSFARPAASRPLHEGPRPILVTVLVTVWLILSGLGALRAIVHLAGAAVLSSIGDADPEARVAAAAPDLATPEMRQHLAQRAERSALERTLSWPLLLIAGLGAAGALGLLRRRTWARPLLLAVGVSALALSAFHADRVVRIATGPAVGLSDPDAEAEARNAVVLLRTAAGIGLLLQSIPLVLAMALLRHPLVRAFVAEGTPARPRPALRPDPFLIVGGAALLVAAGSFLFSKGRTSAPQAAAAGERTAAAAEPETFRWSDQPITFVPPPVSFTRERHAEGGRKGVSFTRYATPPSRIVVAEVPLDTPARDAEEVLSRFRLTAENFRSADSALVGDPVRAVISGQPAFQTDYTLRERSMQHHGREFFSVVRGHAFVFTFLGRDADIPLFENLVASVRFAAVDADPAEIVSTTAAESPRGEAPRGAEVSFRVGEIRLKLRVPELWERVDYGQRQEFRRGEARIVLVDAGRSEAGAPGDEGNVARALRLSGHDPRRWEVFARTRLPVGPGVALAVDTRDPLSHVFHKRTLLFVLGGRLLVAFPEQGSVEETQAPLDSLARSIRPPD